MIEVEAAPNQIAEIDSLARMIALWERVLAVSPIAADDDFFELGGDSLQALAMFHEIERIAGRTLPITAIYDAPTPSRLVALLADGAAPTPFSPLVPFKAGVGGSLFVVHGIGGTVIELKRTAQLLTSPRAVYAIQAKGVDGTEAPLDRVDAMVDYYLAHLRARQPRGPYHLAGYSFGGLIALEMACRLRAAGEQIALLAMIDSFPHPQTFPKSVRQLVRLRSTLDAFRTQPFGAACRQVAARLRGEPLPDAMRGATAEDGTAAQLHDVHDAGLTALSNYRPSAYSGNVVFIRPEISIFPIAPRRVWGKLVGAMSVRTVPGSHTSMVREHAAGLAAALSRSLAEATGIA